MIRFCLSILIVCYCFALLSCSELAASAPSAGSTTVNASAYPDLQAAIDAIPASGGTLVIDGQFEAKPGTACTHVSGSAAPCLYLRSNIRILGDGVTSKIYTTSTSLTALQILASDSITVQGVEFAGVWTKGMQPENAVAVYIDVYGTTPSTRVTVQDCRAHNFPFDGLWARNGTSQIHFLHNESFDNAWNAIEIEAHDSSILDNDLHDNRGQGVEVYSAAQRISIANNHAYRDAVGIKLVNDPEFGELSAISVVGNSVNDNMQDGILYLSTSAGVAPSGLVAITGNTAIGNQHDGISLDYSGIGIVVSDNVVSGNSFADISISQVSDIVVSNNILTALPSAPRAANGILVTPDSLRIHVLNNAVDGF